MLKPVRQNDGATKSERYLARLAKTRFFSLWSYPCLSTVGKNGIAKELVDLAVVFGDDVVLFSDKDIAWPKNKGMEISWSRWYRESVFESAKQLWGAERCLRTSGDKIYLDTKFEEPFPFPIATSRTRYHLVAVAANSVGPAKEYFDSITPGSSGSLILNYDLEPGDILKHPFVVRDLQPTKTFVHVLDESTLDLLLLELSTTADFIHYLSEKERAIRSGALGGALGEEEILGYYLQEATADGFGSLKFPPVEQGSRCSFHIPEGEWRAYCGSAAYRVHANRRLNSDRWAALVHEFSAGIVAANTGEANHVPIQTHELALRVAASENQFSRAHLATSYIEKHETVPADARSARVVASGCAPGRVYVFLFVPWVPAAGSYDEYRAYRLELLHAYATVLPLKVNGVQEAILIGAQSKGSHGGRSEAMIYVRYDQPLSPEAIRLASELMTQEEILSTGTWPAKEWGAKKQPPGRRYGRNDPCPCGSGKKNKKCCDISGPRRPKIYSAMFGGDGNL